jgi:hypothetical protein
MAYEDNKVSKLLMKVKHSLNQWYDTYYMDFNEQLAIAVGTRDVRHDGGFNILRII